MGRLLVLCGMARSGKSTYCKRWLNRKDPLINKVVVNSDEIRLAMHGQRYNKLAEPFVHAVTEIMVRSLFNQGFYVAVDETSTTVGSLRKWLTIDPDAEFIFKNTSLDKCEQRAIACGQNDLVDKGVIKRMHSNLLKTQFYSVELWMRYVGLKDKPEDFSLQEDKIKLTFEKIRREVKNANSR